jgi:signal transduction histidine kinase
MSYGIAIFRDITEQKQLHKMKDEFIAMLNHDLKNIFSSIIGTSQILLDKDVDNNIKPYITIIEKSSNRMLKLANDFLEYFLSENEKLILDITDVNIEEITEDAVSTFRTLFLEKNLDIRIKSDIKEEIQIDCAKIFTVISNLISNAIKFSPENGEININIIKNHDKIKFEIADTGIGIDQVNVEKIFNAFFTLNKNQYRKRKGIGLGLAICKKIIELHGGKIGVESEINNGSTFWFTLPVRN